MGAPLQGEAGSGFSTQDSAQESQTPLQPALALYLLPRRLAFPLNFSAFGAATAAKIAHAVTTPPPPNTQTDKPPACGSPSFPNGFACQNEVRGKGSLLSSEPGLRPSGLSPFPEGWRKGGEGERDGGRSSEEPPVPILPPDPTATHKRRLKLARKPDRPGMCRLSVFCLDLLSAALYLKAWSICRIKLETYLDQ